MLWPYKIQQTYFFFVKAFYLNDDGLATAHTDFFGETWLTGTCIVQIRT